VLGGFEFETSAFSLNFLPPVPFPPASISPTHAAPQHNKVHSDQHVKPCWKNQPTLKLWRESPDSERKSPTIPPLQDTFQYYQYFILIRPLTGRCGFCSERNGACTWRGEYRAPAFRLAPAWAGRRILAHLHSPRGYDEPEILRYSNRQFGLIGADAGHHR
jgi:hypothetical protein